MGTEERRLRRMCLRLLRDLDVQPPLDVRGLCALIGEHRGREIRLLPYPIPATGPFGALVRGSTADHIVYQRDTTRQHQDHIVLHELGHLLAGHISAPAGAELGQPVISEDESRRRFPDLDPVMVRRALRREGYDDAHEQQAETVASVIHEWASVLDGARLRRSTGEARSLDPALGDRLGWL